MGWFGSGVVWLPWGPGGGDVNGADACLGVVMGFHRAANRDVHHDGQRVPNEPAGRLGSLAGCSALGRPLARPRVSNQS